jgi:hypothetical protein
MRMAVGGYAPMNVLEITRGAPLAWRVGEEHGTETTT